MFPIRIGIEQGRSTRTFEALVDSGAHDCLFSASIATELGLDLRNGTASRRNGIGGVQTVWIHPITLYFGAYAIKIGASFAEQLPVSGLLGRSGFFEHFRITFDPTGDIPGMEFERIFRA